MRRDSGWRRRSTARRTPPLPDGATTRVCSAWRPAAGHDAVGRCSTPLRGWGARGCRAGPGMVVENGEASPSRRRVASATGARRLCGRACRLGIPHAANAGARDQPCGWMCDPHRVSSDDDEVARPRLDRRLAERGARSNLTSWGGRGRVLPVDAGTTSPRTASCYVQIEAQNWRGNRRRRASSARRAAGKITVVTNNWPVSDRLGLGGLGCARMPGYRLGGRTRPFSTTRKALGAAARDGAPGHRARSGCPPRGARWGYQFHPRQGAIQDARSPASMPTRIKRLQLGRQLRLNSVGLQAGSPSGRSLWPCAPLTAGAQPCHGGRARRGGCPIGRTQAITSVRHSTLLPVHPGGLDGARLHPAVGVPVGVPPGCRLANAVGTMGCCDEGAS